MFVFAEQCKQEQLPNGITRKIKGWIDDLMVVELTWSKGMDVAEHAHPHRQCCYIVTGSFEGNVNGEKAILRSGDCVYFEADVPHSLVALEDGSVCLDIFTPCREDFIAQLGG